MKKTINQDWLTTEDKASMLTEKELRLMGPRRRDFPFFEALGAALATLFLGVVFALILVGFLWPDDAHGHDPGYRIFTKTGGHLNLDMQPDCWSMAACVAAGDKPDDWTPEWGELPAKPERSDQHVCANLRLQELVLLIVEGERWGEHYTEPNPITGKRGKIFCAYPPALSPGGYCVAGIDPDAPADSIEWLDFFSFTWEGGPICAANHPDLRGE